ncbi:bifunctional hydroxymethylpyrimidine kinase/phosphomethylpyrimidine kinase, partial [Escherichia coli]
QLRSFEEVVEAAKQLVARGVKKVLVKHLGSCSRDKQSFEMLLVTQKQTLHIARPLYTFAQMPVGVGDLICSLMLASLLNGYEDKQALERTNSIVDAVMRLTKEFNSYELCLIDARHQIMDPQILYQATVL